MRSSHTHSFQRVFDSGQLAVFYFGRARVDQAHNRLDVGRIADNPLIGDLPVTEVTGH
jgi:hypothetical protein